MKFHTEYLTFNTKKHREYIHITPPVEAAVKKSGVREGLPAAALSSRGARTDRRRSRC